MKNILLFCVFLPGIQVHAQLNVGNTSLSIKSGTTFFAEGATFTPSGDLDLTGIQIQESNTPVNMGGSVSSVAKVIALSKPLVFSGTLQFPYLESHLNGNTENNLKLAFYSGGTWRTSNASVVNTALNNVDETLNAVSFEQISASESFTTLPVTLASFTARLLTNRSVLLQWQTAMESKNSHFTVEKSSDGIRYAKVGTVEAVNRSSAYDFTDAVPFEGVNYYRLKQSDRNGAEQSHGVRMIKVVGSVSLLHMHPNPVKGNRFILNIRKNVTKPLFYTIVNMAGQQVQSGSIVTQVQQIAITHLTAGPYVLSVDGQFLYFQKQ